MFRLILKISTKPTINHFSKESCSFLIEVVLETKFWVLVCSLFLRPLSYQNTENCTYILTQEYTQIYKHFCRLPPLSILSKHDLFQLLPTCGLPHQTYNFSLVMRKKLVIQIFYTPFMRCNATDLQYIYILVSTVNSTVLQWSHTTAFKEGLGQVWRHSHDLGSTWVKNQKVGRCWNEWAS